MTETPLRLALVTGANKGIGYQSARRLAQAGVTVLLGARDPDRGHTAAAKLADEGHTVHPHVLDVTDAASIAACAQRVEDQFGHLDILVNNAGAGFFACPPSQLDVARLREVFDTNFFGVFMVTHAFLPLLRRAATARIVNVSSGTSSMFLQSNPQWMAYGLPVSAYAMSKTALNMMTVQFAAELHTTNVRINAVEPGYTQTDLTGDQGFQTAEAASAVIAKYALMGPDCPNGGFFDINGPMAW
jgi:NAD(P)-dependent dehydrogenase (short-subunit alcohol dehydrogenase family)